ncbi:MAG TPA: hypothetical protein VK766_05125 [Cytophagaceae bacterium]|jgi:hypothetical protein|nr:hypothetical protein [Cytophagaceae bacterium]
MNLKLTILFIGILFLQFSPDPIEQDLLNYVNVELPKVIPLETEVDNALASVSGANYTSDDAIYKKLNEVIIPKYTEFYNRLKTIKPATEHVRKVHEELLKSSKDQLEAFKLIQLAIQKNSKEDIKKAQTDQDKSAKLITKWKNDLLELCKKHNLEVK